MKRSNINNRGFTLVELLIVIVVIAILAGITIVSYNGIQRQARNVMTISAMKTYQTALANYFTENNLYPTISGTCLGGPYVDYNSDGIQDCGDVNQSYRQGVSPTFNAQMKKYLGNSSALPNVNTKEITSFGNVFVGGYVNYWTSFTVDGQARPYYMMYILEGKNQSCGLTVVTSSSFPTMTSTTQPYSWSDTSANSTMCVVSLSNS